MEKVVKPTKEEVRAWLAERRRDSQPLPNCEEIREALGWKYWLQSSPVSTES